MLNLTSMITWAEMQNKKRILARRPIDVFTRYLKDRGINLNEIRYQTSSNRSTEYLPYVTIEFTNLRRGATRTHVCGHRLAALMFMIATTCPSIEGEGAPFGGSVDSQIFREIKITKDLLLLYLYTAQRMAGDIDHETFLTKIRSVNPVYQNIGTPYAIQTVSHNFNVHALVRSRDYIEDEYTYDDEEDYEEEDYGYEDEAEDEDY